MGKKAKAKAKKRRKKTMVVANPEWSHVKTKLVSKPETMNHLLSPEGLPQLEFSGQLVGTATWSPTFVVRRRGRGRKRLTHLDLYSLEGKDEAKYLAHIKYADSYEVIHVSESAVHLLIKLREHSEALKAVAALVKPKLWLNDSEDFHMLVELTRPLRL